MQYFLWWSFKANSHLTQHSLLTGGKESDQLTSGWGGCRPLLVSVNRLVAMLTHTFAGTFPAESHIAVLISNHTELDIRPISFAVGWLSMIKAGMSTCDASSFSSCMKTQIMFNLILTISPPSEVRHAVSVVTSVVLMTKHRQTVMVDVINIIPAQHQHAMGVSVRCAALCPWMLQSLGLFLYKTMLHFLKYVMLKFFSRW